MVHMRLQRLMIDPVEGGNEIDERRTTAVGVVAHTIELRTITRRQHDGFAERTRGGQRPESGLEPARMKVDSLAQLDRRSAMANSKQYQMQASYVPESSNHRPPNKP